VGGDSSALPEIPPPPSNGGGIHSLVWTQGKYLKDGTPLTVCKENCWKDKKLNTSSVRASPEINNNMGLADACRHYIIEVKVFFRFVSPRLKVCSPLSLSNLLIISNFHPSMRYSALGFLCNSSLYGMVTWL
jgi:hypothetical protein